MLKKYQVTYRLQGDHADHTANCQTEDGYSTTDDFPAMLALRHFGTLSRADEVTVTGFTQL